MAGRGDAQNHGLVGAALPAGGGYRRSGNAPDQQLTGRSALAHSSTEASSPFAARLLPHTRSPMMTNDEDEDDEDDDDTDEFIYDEDQGSLLVDREDCEPGKYWMMDFEDGIMLPSVRRTGTNR